METPFKQFACKLFFEKLKLLIFDAVKRYTCGYIIKLSFSIKGITMGRTNVHIVTTSFAQKYLNVKDWSWSTSSK